MIISVVIPAYNESGNIEIMAKRISEQLKSIGTYEIIFVDDGSTDSTLNEIKKITRTDKSVKYISFSRNFGHQKAIKAGLDYTNGDCVITMDADLQHPPELIVKLIEKWKEGYDIVYTVKKDLKTTDFFKRSTAKLFYKFINKISTINIPLGAADFRLLDRKIVMELRKFNENWLFIRGLVAWLGYNQTGIEYSLQTRHTGKSKYPLRKMISFALQGITSFSIIPLRVSIMLGSFISLISFLCTVYVLIANFYFNITVHGWTLILISVLFLGGVQLIFLGVIGEYLGKLFIETKNRPLYLIKDKNF